MSAVFPNKMMMRPEFVWDESIPVWTPELLGASLDLGSKPGINFYQNKALRSGTSPTVGFVICLTRSEFSTWNSFHAHKWGLESNLPVDHPYKTTPPTV